MISNVSEAHQISMKHRHYNHYNPLSPALPSHFTDQNQHLINVSSSPGCRSMECTRLWAIGRHAPFLGGNPLPTGGSCLDGVRLKLVKASKWMVTSCESVFVEWCSRCFISPNVFLLFSFLGGDISAIPYIERFMKKGDDRDMQKGRINKCATFCVILMFPFKAIGLSSLFYSSIVAIIKYCYNQPLACRLLQFLLPPGRKSGAKRTRMELVAAYRNGYAVREKDDWGRKGCFSPILTGAE